MGVVHNHCRLPLFMRTYVNKGVIGYDSIRCVADDNCQSHGALDSVPCEGVWESVHDRPEGSSAPLGSRGFANTIIGDDIIA